jgi:hypothetical protein
MTTLQIIAIVFGIAMIPLSYHKIMLYKKQIGAYTFRGFHLFFLCFLIVIGSAITINHEVKAENLVQHNKKVAWALSVIKADYEEVFGEVRDEDNKEYFALLPNYHKVEGNLFDRMEDYI